MELGGPTLQPQAFSPHDFPQVFEARLAALSRADRLISAERSGGASLLRLLEQARACDSSRYTLEGPDITLHSDCAFAVSLLFHELATNAAVHGSLSVSTGHVDVRWHLEDGTELVLVWNETGGPPARRPGSPGFGSLLVTYAAVKLKGSADFLYRHSGLCCNLRISLLADWPRRRGAMFLSSSTRRVAPGRTM